MRGYRWIPIALGLVVGCGEPVGDDETQETDVIDKESNPEQEEDSNGRDQSEDENGDGATNGEVPEESKEPKETNNSQEDEGANNAATNGETGEALRLSSIYESVFEASGCTSGYCHGSFQIASPEQVADAFVDVEAPEPLCGRTHYVVPGAPEESILWVRVRPLTDEDVECEVVKMPNGSETGLDEETAQLVHDWISDGALL